MTLKAVTGLTRPRTAVSYAYICVPYYTEEPEMAANTANKGRPGEMRAQVVAMAKARVSVRRIAYALDLSTTAVHEHIRKARELGELPPKEEARTG